MSFPILFNSLIIVGKLSIGLSLHFVVFGFILFQYDLQMMSLPDSSYSCSHYSNRTPELYICTQISGWFDLCITTDIWW